MPVSPTQRLIFHLIHAAVAIINVLPVCIGKMWDWRFAILVKDFCSLHPAHAGISIALDTFKPGFKGHNLEIDYNVSIFFPKIFFIVNSSVLMRVFRYVKSFLDRMHIRWQ